MIPAPRRLPALAALLALAAPLPAQVAPALAPVAPAPAPAPASPADLYGDLFRAVQLGRVFPDGKTFVDAVPRRSVAEIMAAYAARRPATTDALRSFVLANFLVPGVNDRTPAALRDHVRQLWPVLTRPYARAEPGGSALPLDRPFVVPGGRFREIYYWDSYFTMLGLVADGRAELVQSMLDDFTSLIERYGHVPNGTRSYYLSRSQPPFFALMLDLVPAPDAGTAGRRLAALRREHDWWMAGASCLDGDGDGDGNGGGACARVVRMPDGSLLNRYWDDRDSPRDESWAEDVATAAGSGRPAREVQRSLRAAAESGWDFGSRWLSDPARLASIRTPDIVPVDLNSLLLAAERAIARRCRQAGDAPCAARYDDLARRRAAAIDRYLWSPGLRRYADWDRTARAPTPRVTAALLFPLFTGAASPAQARATAALVRNQLLAPGGLRTSRERTGQQWDAPNGWAPLQWVAIAGLARYGEQSLARDVAARWMGTVSRTFVETGRMLEKYDVEERRPGGGGEYPNQDGFGWTNGVASALLDRYPDLLDRSR